MSEHLQILSMFCGVFVPIIIAVVRIRTKTKPSYECVILGILQGSMTWFWLPEEFSGDARMLRAIVGTVLALLATPSFYWIYGHANRIAEQSKRDLNKK
jgi:hypothetical protein